MPRPQSTRQIPWNGNPISIRRYPEHLNQVSRRVGNLGLRSWPDSARILSRLWRFRLWFLHCTDHHTQNKDAGERKLHVETRAKDWRGEDLDSENKKEQTLALGLLFLFFSGVTCTRWVIIEFWPKQANSSKWPTKMTKKNRHLSGNMEDGAIKQDSSNRSYNVIEAVVNQQGSLPPPNPTSGANKLTTYQHACCYDHPCQIFSLKTMLLDQFKYNI